MTAINSVKSLFNSYILFSSVLNVYERSKSTEFLSIRMADVKGQEYLMMTGTFVRFLKIHFNFVNTTTMCHTDCYSLIPILD